MKGWRAWYADGAVYDSRQTAWAALPRQGFVAAVLYLDEDWAQGKPYRRLLTDSYVWQDPTRRPDDDQAYGQGEGDPPALDLTHPEQVKVGLHLPDAVFAAIEARAMAAETWD